MRRLSLRAKLALEERLRTEQMAIRVKEARTDGEVDDALWVRHEVFVIEDGKFGGRPLSNERLIDRFDGFPSTHNIIAYEGNEPVATMRLIQEGRAGLPADELYDFSEYRSHVAESFAPGGDGHRDDDSRQGADPTTGPVFGSAGMLAVRGPWRRKRSVIRAMYKMAATVCHQSDTTHVIVAVNHETAGMYRRLGFEALAEKAWAEHVGNHVVPLAATAEQFVAWAFGSIPESPLGGFVDSFERVIVAAGQPLFLQGDAGSDAYIVESGTVRILRRAPDGTEIVLAHLGRGAMLGELALIDDKPRSATVIASTDVELISLGRSAFWEQVMSNPVPLRDVLRMLSGRIRTLDDMLMVHAFAPARQRLEFALDVARLQTTPDRKSDGHFVFPGGPAAIAASAAVKIEDACLFLEQCSSQGLLEFTSRKIRFVRQ